MSKKSQNYISASKARETLGLSRRTFDKIVENGVFSSLLVDKGKKGKVPVYSEDDISRFMETDDYQQLIKGTVDPRNKLNDLTGKDWLPETKSFFYQKGLGANHPDAQIEIQHPAPFSFQDIERLVLFFTKQGMTVLDPFGGVGSTAKACETTGRTAISIELSPKYHKLSIERLEKEVGKGASKHHRFINGDSRVVLPTLETESVDFIVTSPPYWGILNKQDQKVIKERVENNLDTKYSEDERDIGNVEKYADFLRILKNDFFLECFRILRKSKYMAIVVSDFRDKNEFISFHSDIIHMLNGERTPDGKKIILQGTKILLQNHKSLLPYGYPFSYVENIHHQYVLIFKKG